MINLTAAPLSLVVLAILHFCLGVIPGWCLSRSKFWGGIATLVWCMATAKTFMGFRPAAKLFFVLGTAHGFGLLSQLKFPAINGNLFRFFSLDQHRSGDDYRQQRPRPSARGQAPHSQSGNSTEPPPSYDEAQPAQAAHNPKPEPPEPNPSDKASPYTYETWEDITAAADRISEKFERWHRSQEQTKQQQKQQHKAPPPPRSKTQSSKSSGIGVWSHLDPTQYEDACALFELTPHDSHSAFRARYKALMQSVHVDRLPQSLTPEEVKGYTEDNKALNIAMRTIDRYKRRKPQS